MKLIKKTVLLSSILLSACSLKERTLPPLSLSALQSAKKGVVFLSVSEENTDHDDGQVYGLKRLGDKNTEAFIIRPEMGWAKGVINYAHNHLLFLDPGFYYVDSINRKTEFRAGYTIYKKYLSPGIQDNIIRYGAFEVKGGEVLDIGKLRIPHFTLESDRRQIYASLENSEKSALLKTMKKGKFFPRGSIIFYDKNKKMQCVDSNTVKQIQKSITQETIKKLQQK